MADSTSQHYKQQPISPAHTRHLSWAGSQDGSATSPTGTQQLSRKRSADRMASDGIATRKGRACLACRKLKVKCDSLEKGDEGCSRCQRLGMECVTSKRLRVSLEDGEGQPHPAVVRLDKAVDDILSRLKMPNLDSYGSGQIENQPQNHAPVTSMPDSVTQTTRENSRDPVPVAEQHDIAGAPMEGLFEATQLNTLRARLKADPTAKSSRRKMESDLLSQGMITMEEAEEMFRLFKTSLSRYLFDATLPETRNLKSVRESSTLFFTAIMTVASLHIPGKEKIHLSCHRQLRELIQSSMFDRFHTLDDIRALCVAAFWLPDLSWKLSGHCIRIATELNLHQAFFKGFSSAKQSVRERTDALERARLWYLLYVLDHHFSIAYGRPPVIAEWQAIKETDHLLNSPECTPSDRRVISQVTLFVILSRAYNMFGLEAERLMDGDEASLIRHRGFLEDIERWRIRFREWLMVDTHVGDYPAIGVDLHFYFATMMLNSLALRGRSLSSLHTLPPSLRPLALSAIDSAHGILSTVLEQPDIMKSLVGVPLYLHSMIAFATVFLIKMSSRWKALGVGIDPDTQTRPLIEGIIRTMRECRAGANHILYSMATGFERLLHRNVGGANGHAKQEQMPVSLAQLQDPAGRHFSAPNIINDPTSYQSSPTSGYAPGQLQRTTSAYDTTGNGISPSSGSATFGGWQTEDEMLWSIGMGYDLLATAPEVSGPGYALSDLVYPNMQ